MNKKELEEFEIDLDNLSKEELFLMFKDSLYHTYKMRLKRDNLQQKIDKAIEYCKTMYTYGIRNNRQQAEELLTILGDKENE